MQSLGPYRIAESQIKLRKQSGTGDVKFGEIRRTRSPQKHGMLVAVKQLRVNADMSVEERSKFVIVSSVVFKLPNHQTHHATSL